MASRSRSPSTTPAYATLRPRTTHVSAARILKKWRPLPQPSQDRAKQVLLGLKAESKANRRNATLKKGSKKLDLSGAEWEGVVDDLVQRLCERVPRMPFPPTKAGKDEGDFDFEGTLDKIDRLEGEVAGNVQAARLLREQIRREERALVRDKAELATLEEGVRSERALARRQEGRLHTIARGLDEGGAEVLDVGVDRKQDEKGLGWQARRMRAKVGLAAAEIEGDEQLAPLVKQLRSHLGSMSNNTVALKPVREALEDAEAAMEVLAWKGLGRVEYQRVVGLNI